MIDQVMKFLLFASILVPVAVSFIYFARHLFFTFREIRAPRPLARDLKKRPNIDIILLSENSESHIASCLESIRTQSYKKYCLIIADNASNDRTKEIVREFIKKYPKINVRLVANRTKKSETGLVASGLKYAKNELVMTMHTSERLREKTLHGAIKHFLREKTQVVLPNIQLHHNYKLSGLLSQTRLIASVWSKKSKSPISSRDNTWNYASIYRRQALANLINNNAALHDVNSLDTEAYYAHDTLVDSYAHRSAVKTVNQKIRSRQAVLARKRASLIIYALQEALIFLEPVIIGFFIYVALTYAQYDYLVLAWGAFTALTSISIWSNASKSMLAKINLSLLAFPLYILHLLQSAMLTIVSLLKGGYSFCKWISQEA